MQGFDDDEAILSAATTPSLPIELKPKLETCFCCPSHAVAPPDVAMDDQKFYFAMPVCITQASPEHNRETTRRAHDPISPRIQKQISWFEGADISAEASVLHASINLPAAAQQLRQDTRLRKFENVTQSTSNSNFPFESNTLKRVPLVSTKDDHANVSHTQSCINLKTSGGAGSGSGSLSYGSPKNQRDATLLKERQEIPTGGCYKACPANYNPLPNAQSVCCFLDLKAGCSTSAPNTLVTLAAPHPDALIVKERFIEPPKRGVVRGYHGKTQSMDADFLFNEFFLLPAVVQSLDVEQEAKLEASE